MRLLGSLSFRLAMTYAALFLASISILTGLYYWAAIWRPLEAIRTELSADGARLADLYGRVGADGLVRILENRAGAPSPRLAYHALLRPDGSVVAANLPSWPQSRSVSWLRIDADISRQGEEDEYEALVLDTMLPGGGRLLIGRDIEDLDELEEGLQDTTVWLLPALVLLVIGGGLLMSQAIGRRIEAIGAVARRVMQGSLSERVPVRGTSDDFDRLSETLNLMLDRIEASLKSVRRVSDSVAHELRTPLARLQADLKELEAELPKAAASRLGRATEEAAMLGRMFDAVLRISRIEAERHVAEMQPLDLSSLLLDAAELYQPLAEERALSLHVQVASGLRVIGDRDLLFQAIGNLLDNAIKFTPPNGRVALAAEESGEGIRIAVTDTGPGIPDELRDKVTERFFRGPSLSNVPGFGLGLSLVAAVAARHHSILSFASAEPGLRVEWHFT